MEEYLNLINIKKKKINNLIKLKNFRQLESVIKELLDTSKYGEEINNILLWKINIDIQIKICLFCNITNHTDALKIK